MSKYGSNGVDHEKYYTVPAPNNRTLSGGNSVKSGPDVSKWLKNISITIGIMITLGGLVWGAAFFTAGLVTDDDHKRLKDRIEMVEKNDIAQTVLLENIDKKVDRIEDKIDDILKKD